MNNKLLYITILFVCGTLVLGAKPSSKNRKSAASRTHHHRHHAKSSLLKEIEPLSFSDNEPRKDKIPFDETNLVQDLSAYIKSHYKKQTFDSYLFVSIKNQKMYHIVDNNVVKTYTISGSKNGAGNRFGSNQTPVGLHTIIEKFGYTVPKAGLLVERSYTGKVTKIHKEKFCVGSDDVTSRVLWLRGEEPGLNQGGNIDSYKRFIYIHGTPEEGLIGVPSSEGCIRMKNNEVIDLFSFAYVGMKVLILKDF